MKLTTFIMIIALGTVSAKGIAQRISLNVSNTPIEKVLQSIKQQSGFGFIYNAGDLKNQKVSVRLTEVSVEDAVEAVIKNLSMEYTIREKNIVLTKKEKSYLETVIARFQAIDVRGKVVDSLGNGLAGATVSVKGAKQSTSTNNNGDFYLKNIEENALLVVSYLGFVTKEQAIDKDYTFVRMQMSTSKLDEIQVVAYGVTSKRLNTGTVTTVKAEEIERQNINNPLLALQGKVPNLVITPQSGVPGANVRLQLRGENSFMMGDGVFRQPSTPLIVIDGVPFVNNVKMQGAGEKSGDTGNDNAEFSALNYINPKDIESIDVLSDASATAIYGSRGGNGVILITTKKAKAGSTVINAGISGGFSQLPASSRFDVLGTKDYLTMRREAIANDGAIAQIERPWDSGYAPDLLLWDQNKETDWQKELFSGNPRWSTAEFSISGGVPAVQYRVGGTFQQNSYPLPRTVQANKGSKFQMGTVNFNLTGNSANGKLSMSLGGSYSVNNEFGNSGNFYEMAVLLAPNAPNIYHENGELNWALNPNLTERKATWKNPYADLQNIRETNTTNLISNFSLGYKILPELGVKITGGYTELKRNNSFFLPIAAQDPSIFNVNGTANYNVTRLDTWSLDPQITFNKKIALGTFNLITGASLQGQNTYGEGYGLGGYKDDGLIRNLAASGSITGANMSSEYRYLRFFGRLGYNWANKYLMDLSASRDGSSRFGPGNLYGSYWGAGAGWIFTEEPLIKRILPFLSFGKLRGSYGSNGSDGIGDYNYIELYQTTNGNNSYQGANTLTSRGAINPNYSWEDIRKSEVALELGLFKDRVILGTSYWITRGGNQLTSLTLPGTTGSDRPLYENQDIRLQNSGWNFTLDLTTISSKNFTWKTSANFGLQFNKLLALPDKYSGWTYAIDPYKLRGEDPIGKPVSGIKFLSEYRGVDQMTGLYVFSDKEGNIDTRDNYYFSVFRAARKVNLTPRNLAVSNTFSYKGLNLFLNLQLVKQQVSNLAPLGFVGKPGFFSEGKGNQHIDVMGRWTTENTNANVQKFTQFYTPAFFANMAATFSDFGYTDASYIRLRTASFSYNLPSAICKVIKVQNARLSLNAQNLFTITNFKGGDPETQINASGIAMPMLRTITAGLNVQF